MKIISVVCLLSAIAFSQIVQQVAGTVGATGAVTAIINTEGTPTSGLTSTTLTLTFTNNLFSGSGVVVGVRTTVGSVGATCPVISLADNASGGSNTYTFDITYTDTVDLSECVYIARAPVTHNISGGSTVLTLTVNGFSYWDLAAYSMSAMLSSPVDVSATAHQGFGTAHSVGPTSNTTASDSCFAIDGLNNSTYGPFTNGSGFGSQQFVTDAEPAELVMEAGNFGSGSAVTAGLTLTGNGKGTMALQCYKA